jgi:hypothetical protein
MSKRKRTSKIIGAPTNQFIYQSLRTNFHCTEEEIDLIGHALAGRCPIEIAEFIEGIHAGKVPLPIRRPKIHLDMEDGTFQTIQFTNHPANLLMDYLDKRYDRIFSFLYWSALTPPNSPKDFYELMRLAKKAPFFAEAIAQRGQKEVQE